VFEYSNQKPPKEQSQSSSYSSSHNSENEDNFEPEDSSLTAGIIITNLR